MARPSNAPPQRSRRNVYPTDVTERTTHFKTLLEAQLMKYDTDLNELPYLIGHTAKTTLRNRALSGNLSLKDMLWISDYCEIDWNSIIYSLKLDHEPYAVPVLATEEDLLEEQETPAIKAPVRKPKVNKGSAKAKRFGNLLLDSAEDTQQEHRD